MTRFLSSERAIYAALVLYFAMGFLVRMFFGPGLELDEAEMVLQAQHFAFGYGPQLPVYNWYQALVFQMFGVSVAAIAGAKFSALALGACLAVAAVRRLTGDRAAGAVAGLALVLLPDLMWEAQRSLTHSVALIVATTATLWAYAGVLRFGRWRDYIVFGIVFGLACLSKANIYLMLVPAIAVLAWLRPARAGFLPLVWGRLCGAALIAAAIVAGPVFWIMNDTGAATASSSKFYRGGDNAVLAFLAGEASALVLCLIFWGGMALVLRRRTPHVQDRRLDLVIRAMFSLWGLATVVVFVAGLGIGVTRISPRWLLPLSICFTMAMALWVYRKAPVTAGRAMGWTALGLGGLVLVALVATRAVMPSRLNADAPALASDVAQIAAQTHPDLVSGDNWLAGMLGLYMPVVAEPRCETARVLEVRSGEEAKPLLPECPARLVGRQTVQLGFLGARPKGDAAKPISVSVWEYSATF